MNMPPASVDDGRPLAPRPMAGVVKVREYTPAEADALVPQLAAWLPRLREATHEAHDLQAQLEDLVRMYGDALADPGCEAHGDAAGLREAQAEAAARARALYMEFQALGVEIKDPITGLVDFYGRREGELVYLCWKEGESTVAHWHPLVGGFAARKPL